MSPKYPTAQIDDCNRVLKHGDTFAVFDCFGDIDSAGLPKLGIYHQDTRFLSRLSLRIGNEPLQLLKSTISEDNTLFTVDLTNFDVVRGGEILIPRGTIHVSRSCFLWEAACYQRLRIHNHNGSSIEQTFVLRLDADFRDLFEVRGIERKRRGRLEPLQIIDNHMEYCYQGLDRQWRRTSIVFDPPAELSEAQVCYRVRLEPGAQNNYEFAIHCEPNVSSPRSGKTGAWRSALSYDQAARKASADLERAKASEPEIFTANKQFKDWLNRSNADLHMMLAETQHGPYPYAGVPWYNTAFGRDGIICALECLWFNPEIARGVLTYLAATQAETENAGQDAQPGKIVHEARSGEMAALGEIPFGRYYGSIDATPLFVMLAGDYYRRTGNLSLIQSIWPNIERALQWMREFGDVDGDGFLEYTRRAEHGLANQGWKDSQDAIFYENGELAEGPIALCEVQGYAFAAKRAAAELATALDKRSLANELAGEAEELQCRFEESFWCEELSTYGLALDGKKRLCRVRTSNAGHCLFAGIARKDRAHRVAATLLDENSFSGWGVRTVAAGEARYNPRSYHNGAIWPHDNALIADGLSRYGLKSHAARILQGLFDASQLFDLHRLPELFCGFPRRAEEGPTLYPVSCSPQSWAAGAALLLLQSCLGLTIDAPQNKIVFNKPFLPLFLPRIKISGIQVGGGVVDLVMARDGSTVSVDLLQSSEPVDVVIL